MAVKGPFYRSGTSAISWMNLARSCFHRPLSGESFARRAMIARPCRKASSAFALYFRRTPDPELLKGQRRAVGRLADRARTIHVCVAAQDYVVSVESPLYQKRIARLPKFEIS